MQGRGSIVHGTALVNMGTGDDNAPDARMAELRTRLESDRLFLLRFVLDNNLPAVQANWERIMGTDAPQRRMLEQRLTQMIAAGAGDKVARITTVPWVYGANELNDEVIASMYAEVQGKLSDPSAPEHLAGGNLKWFPVVIAGATALVNAVSQLVGSHQAAKAQEAQARAYAEQMRIAAAAQERQAWYSRENMKTILIATGIGLVLIIVIVLALRKKKT